MPDTLSCRSVIYARLAIGMIVLITAEIFSGASVQHGVWHPLTWILTYWLYFAHFFFFTTLAIRTGRISLSSLYLWGVLYGLYESWITKVIWHGYNHDFKPVLGHVGPYGYAELSMVFIFHPVMSFILPLAVACVLCPSLGQQFPDLQWMTGNSRSARFAQWYIVGCFIIVMAINSGGTLNLALNLLVCLGLLAMLLVLAQRGFRSDQGRRIAMFKGWGFKILCGYLAVLYGLMYLELLPEGLPGPAVQLATLAFYAVPITGLWLHKARQPDSDLQVNPQAIGQVVTLFAILMIGALILSTMNRVFAVRAMAVVNFMLWTPAGWLLTAWCLVIGWKEHRRTRQPSQDSSAI